jgi:hypothetical protein
VQQHHATLNDGDCVAVGLQQHDWLTPEQMPRAIETFPDVAAVQYAQSLERFLALVEQNFGPGSSDLNQRELVRVLANLDAALATMVESAAAEPFLYTRRIEVAAKLAHRAAIDGGVERAFPVLEEGWAGIATHAEAAWLQGLMTSSQFVSVLMHLASRASEILSGDTKVAQSYFLKAMDVDPKAAAGCVSSSEMASWYHEMGWTESAGGP